MKPKGMVYLVGAGPGEVGMLTLRAAEVLARAEVVVAGEGVSHEVLALASPTAEFIGAESGSGPAAQSPEEVGRLLAASARAGKRVVRLIGGDPYLFGGGGEEAEWLAGARVPFEVVPGVSALVAGPNCAGFPLAHRQWASQITLLAGTEAPTAVDWAQVARAPGTRVIALAPERIGPTVELLAAQGLAPETPVAVVGPALRGRHYAWQGTLATIAGVVAREEIRPPAMLVIGGVVQLRARLNWFERRPLFGQRIAITRARAQAGELARQLRELGAEVLEVPTLRFEAPSRRQDLVDALLELNAYDWLVFTSPNGVTRFFEYFFRRFHDLRDLGGARLAAVGPGTASKLRELHLQVDLVPDEALGAEVARAFSQFESVENLKICLLRAEAANRDLPEALTALGAIVDDVACYQTVPETEDATGAAASLRERGADWVVFTSGSTVRNFHARFDLPALRRQFPQLKAAVIGPETARALAALGVAPACEARPHTLEGLVKTLLAAAAAK